MNTLTRTQQQVHIATTSGLAISSANTGGKYVLSNSASLQYRNYIKAPPAGDSSYTALSSTLPLTFGVDANSNGVFNEVDSVTGTPLDGQAIACNYLNWVDLTAYADWAGLRPYTEFEFEKAARGTDMNAPNLVAHSATTPVDREFVWGSKRVINPKAIVNSALADETADVVNAKEAGVANYKSLINGPLRSGFAATSNASRLESGASYYGVMDLSGNLYEHIVSAGRNLGANFHGNVTGNGELDSFGYADIANWPGYQTVSGNSYINSGDGSGYRGGSWTSDIDPATLMSELHTSDRSIAGYDDYGAAGPNGSRFNNVGVRLGKTAYPQPY